MGNRADREQDREGGSSCRPGIPAGWHPARKEANDGDRPHFQGILFLAIASFAHHGISRILRKKGGWKYLPGGRGRRQGACPFPNPPPIMILLLTSGEDIIYKYIS
jgi:hypothetical protein